jgi:hypothetical protein
MGERKAFAAPITARAARKLQISGASAHPSAAAPKPTYPARTTRRGPSRSATVPEKSCRRANGTMYAVMAAATWVIEASSPSATFGMMAMSIAPPNGPRKPPT